MIKKFIVSSLLLMSVIGMMPIAVSAAWKEDKFNNRSWVEKGVQAKGWNKIEGKWYNFGNNGVMQTGWMKDNGSWYYCWSDGTMAVNSWLTNGDFWYYFDGNGKMISDSVIIGKREYDFNEPAVIVSQELKTIRSEPITNTLNNN
jgi:glucan-binding YG repeat protein